MQALYKKLYSGAGRRVQRCSLYAANDYEASNHDGQNTHREQARNYRNNLYIYIYIYIYMLVNNVLLKTTIFMVN